jgi:glycosyltransferase involved in cell wall biosynthesis
MNWTLINAASVYAEKAPALWLEIASACIAAHEDVSALWIGQVQEDYAELIRAAVALGGGRIAFPGAATNSEVLAQLASPGAILLIASDIEVFPVSVMEATQLGVPVICRRFPGHDEVLGSDYPLAFSGAGEALRRFDTVVGDYDAACRGARELFERRFRKDDAWYAAAAGLTLGPRPI